MCHPKKIRVLIVDDSAIVRKILTDALSEEADIEVVGTAPDPFVARDKIVALQPDILTLDVEMPRMDGLTFLGKLMHYRPMPVVVISSLGQASCETALEALRLGAVEVMAKPGGPYSVGELRMRLAATIRAAAASRPRRGDLPARTTAQDIAVPERFHPGAVIAIGASTGGTEAIKEVLVQLPANCPGIVITQHIPPVFSRAFADRLNTLCKIEVREASSGDRLLPGRALVAPGNFHMLLHREGAEYRVEVKDGPQVCYQRPSVDVLFGSVAKSAGPNSVGVLLTGMGTDGARGLLAIKQAGGRTVVQDEATCVVYGMPRAAVELRAADRILPIGRIAPAIISEAASRTESQVLAQ